MRFDVIPGLAITATALLLAAGCSTPEANPPSPRAHTGYVDFHAAPVSNLWWEVSRFDERSQSYQRVYSKMKAPEGGVLRLAFPPGTQRLRVAFLNQAIAAPADITVEVRDGMVTPVRVLLQEAATASVRTKERDWEGMAKGRYGSRTQVGLNEAVVYELSATIGVPGAYQPKDRMPIPK